MKKFYKDSGIAMLEAAGALFFLIVLLLGGIALVEYMRISRDLNGLIEKYIYESGFKPYRIASGVILDEAGLKSYIIKASDNIAAGLNNFGQDFFVEAAYTEAKINSKNGRFDGFVKDPYSYSYTNGNDSVKSHINIKLEEVFSHFAHSKAATSDNGETRALFAIPNAGFGLSEATNIFLPSTVLVGVRAGVSVENTLIGNMLEVLGNEPFLSEYKIVTLRGEISDEI